MRTSREELARMSTEQLKEIIRLDSQGVEEGWRYTPLRTFCTFWT